jgi:hypothetical protein
MRGQHRIADNTTFAENRQHEGISKNRVNARALTSTPDEASGIRIRSLGDGIGIGNINPSTTFEG